MALVLNPNLQSDSTSFQEDVKESLRSYAGLVLSTETPILAPNPGFKAYNKRVAFAEKAKLNPELYTEQAASFISELDSSMINNVINANQILYRWFLDANPSGRNIFECEKTISTYNHVGTTSGRSIFDVLASVNQSDLI